MANIPNKLSDLNNHLFEQLERLSDDLDAETLDNEVVRTKAITSISAQIISNAKLQLDAVKLQCEYGNEVKLNGLLEINNE